MPEGVTSPPRAPSHSRASQQMPDPLRGAWFMEAFFRVWLPAQDATARALCGIGLHRWQLWFPAWGLMSNRYKCARCLRTKSVSASP